MAIGSLLLFLALLILVALFVARPLLEENGADRSDEDASAPWIAERERVLDALAELDADWQLGKVPEDAYKQQRQQLLAKGAAALAQLDKIAARQPLKRKVDAGDDLEALIAAYKRKKTK